MEPTLFVVPGAPAACPRFRHARVARAPRRRIVLLALAGMLVALTSRADDWSPKIIIADTWNSNATNADVSTDQIDSLQIQADVLASQRYPMGRDDSFHLGVHLAADWWPRYHGLTTAAGGGRAEWRHKFGVSALAPVFSFEGAADAIVARETGRHGLSTGVTLALRKRFNNLTRGTLSHGFSWHDARFSTFDRSASETTFEIDRDLTDLTRLTFTVRFQDGDVISYGAPRAELAALATSQMTSESFGRPLIAYRIDARTWMGRIAFLRALDQNSAIVAAYEWRKTERNALSLVNNLVSVALVHQF